MYCLPLFLAWKFSLLTSPAACAAIFLGGAGTLTGDRP